MYLSGVLPWKSSAWVAPPPEEIARIRKEAGTELAVDDPEDQIQQHRSREQDAAALAAAQEKERELDRSSGEAEEEHREGETRER